MPRFRFVAVVVACAVALTAAPVGAQYMSSFGYSFNNPISATCNSLLWQKMNQRMLLRTMLKERGYTDAQLGQMSSDQMLAALGGAKQAAEACTKLPVPATAATKFKPTGKRLVVPALATALTEDKAQQAALREVFEAGLKAYEAEAGKDGLANDLAGAVAFFLGTAYLVFHDGEEPDGDGLTLLARGLQLTMDTPELKEVSAADKQKFYELLVSLSTWLGVTWQQAVQDGDEALKAQLKDAAAAALKGYLKLEPEKVRITASGLEVAP